jgi:hypothetical protein
MEPRAERNEGVEWSAASLSLGGVFAVMVPATLVLVAYLEGSRYQTFSTLDKRLAALGGNLAALLILSLLVIGLIFGIRGLIASRRQQRPIVLGLAGILLNAVDLVLWAATALAWNASILGHL